MNERLEELAEQAGLDAKEIREDESLTLYAFEDFDLKRFAELVRADEREANAKLADDFERLEYEAVGDPRIPAFKSLIGEAIRARGNHEQD
jgi:hypothetical protein